MQKAFGYTYDELKQSYSADGKNMDGEAIAAMGDGYPASGTSAKQSSRCSTTFKQLFAQVTNPPIDAIREEVVTSTTTYIGN